MTLIVYGIDSVIPSYNTIYSDKITTPSKKKLVVVVVATTALGIFRGALNFRFSLLLLSHLLLWLVLSLLSTPLSSSTRRSDHLPTRLSLINNNHGSLNSQFSRSSQSRSSFYRASHFPLSLPTFRD